MAFERYSMQDILGLTPSVDMRRSAKLYALNGANYVFDSKGVRSPFGSRLLLPHPLSSPAHVQGVRLKLRNGDRTFVFVAEGIMEWSETLGGWRLLYLTPDTTLQPYRWTYAYLNGIVYFCHPQTGILAYNIEADIAYKLEGAGVPANAIAIVENNGRLGVMDDLYLTWSAQSDGTNFAPSLGGPGFQLIGDRVPGFPLIVTSYTQGMLVWTSGGVMRSEFTGDSAVYRHRAINSEYRPINSFCTAKMNENTIVILDERGLFQSQGEAPTPFAPLFNEFLLDYIQRLNLKLGQNVRLEWDDLQRRLYLSVSLSYSSPIYEKCFVLYPPLDKWGQFSESHYGILPITLKGGERDDDYYGFVGDDSRLRLWSEVGSREVAADDRYADLAYPVVQKPFGQLGVQAGYVLASSGVLATSAGRTQLAAGYYPRDGVIRITAKVTGLAAKIQIGLLRLGEKDSISRMFCINEIMVGNIVSGASDRIRVDYLTVPPATADEDYLVETGGEDFGLEESNYVNHSLRVVGTIDGATIFDQVIPDLVRFDKATRHYACMVNGIWHMIEIGAESVGEAFHVQTLEVTATDAGAL